MHSAWVSPASFALLFALLTDLPCPACLSMAEPWGSSNTGSLPFEAAKKAVLEVTCNIDKNVCEFQKQVCNASRKLAEVRNKSVEYLAALDSKALLEHDRRNCWTSESALGVSPRCRPLSFLPFAKVPSVDDIGHPVRRVVSETYLSSFSALSRSPETTSDLSTSEGQPEAPRGQFKDSAHIMPVPELEDVRSRYMHFSRVEF